MSVKRPIPISTITEQVPKVRIEQSHVKDNHPGRAFSMSDSVLRISHSARNEAEAVFISFHGDKTLISLYIVREIGKKHHSLFARMATDDLSTDGKNVKLTCSIVDEIYEKLEREMKAWSERCRTAPNATVNVIQQYLKALMSMRKACESLNVVAFLLTFDEYGITMNGIKKCFYSSKGKFGGNVKGRRNAVLDKFQQLCGIMEYVVKHERIEEKSEKQDKTPDTLLRLLKAIQESAQNEKEAEVAEDDDMADD